MCFFGDWLAKRERRKLDLEMIWLLLPDFRAGIERKNGSVDRGALECLENGLGLNLVWGVEREAFAVWLRQSVARWDVGVVVDMLKDDFPRDPRDWLWKKIFDNLELQIGKAGLGLSDFDLSRPILDDLAKKKVAQWAKIRTSQTLERYVNVCDELEDTVNVLRGEYTGLEVLGLNQHQKKWLMHVVDGMEGD